MLRAVTPFLLTSPLSQLLCLFFFTENFFIKSLGRCEDLNTQRKRERETERERERETERGRERQRETERDIDRQTERQRILFV